eukprot:82471_1
MKFATLAVALSLFSRTAAFAPNAGQHSITNRVANNVVANGPVVVNSDTSLSLFGRKKFNSPAKVDGDITEKEVRALFELWNSALATGDSRIVANRYTKSPVLLPTVSDQPRTDFSSIEDYFVNFLKLEPQGEILDSHVTIGQNWCSDVGIYEFTMGATGKKVKGRYSFIYVYEDGEWKI